jgi:hypothetical protein
MACDSEQLKQPGQLAASCAVELGLLTANKEQKCRAVMPVAGWPECAPAHMSTHASALHARTW